LDAASVSQSPPIYPFLVTLTWTGLRSYALDLSELFPRLHQLLDESSPRWLPILLHLAPCPGSEVGIVQGRQAHARQPLS